MVEDEGGDGGLRLHHHPFGELDADFFRVDQFPDSLLVVEIRAGGVAETVALSPILGGKSFFHCHLGGIGEPPILADSSMEPFRRRLRRFNRQCLEGV